jgi:hypothetical protein
VAPAAPRPAYQAPAGTHGPLLETSDPGLVHAVADAMSHAPPQHWGSLAELAGIHAGDGVGPIQEWADPRSGTWQVGQALSLQQAGRADLAQSILSGHSGGLLGKDVVKPLLHNEAAGAAFDSHYAHRPILHDDGFNPHERRPHAVDLDGKKVAFLYQDEATGLAHEVRGKVVAQDPNRALFTLQGDPAHQFNLNSINHLAKLPTWRSMPSAPAVDPQMPPPGRPEPSAPLTQDDVLNVVSWPGMPSHETQALLERYGVHPNQATQGYQPEDRTDWRLGQGLALIQQGHPEWGQRALSGGLDQWAGQETLPKLQQDVETANRFDQKYHAAGWTLSRQHSPSFHPAEFDGRTVAFLDRNPESGQLEEYRGIARAADPRRTALFTVDTQPGRQFNNNFIDHLAVQNS